MELEYKKIGGLCIVLVLSFILSQIFGPTPLGPVFGIATIILIVILIYTSLFTFAEGKKEKNTSSKWIKKYSSRYPLSENNSTVIKNEVPMDSYNNLELEIDEVIQELFSNVITTIPIISLDVLASEYTSLVGSWKCTGIARGNEQDIREVIKKNLKIICQSEGVSGVYSSDIQKYPKDFAAQIGILRSINGRHSIIPIRLWRTNDEYFACGNSQFVGNTLVGSYNVIVSNLLGKESNKNQSSSQKETEIAKESNMLTKQAKKELLSKNADISGDNSTKFKAIECAKCNNKFDWNHSFNQSKTPDFRNEETGNWRPRVFCPYCGSAVAEWDINFTKDNNQWIWCGDNKKINDGKDFPPNPLGYWGIEIPFELAANNNENEINIEKVCKFWEVLQRDNEMKIIREIKSSLNLNETKKIETIEVNKQKGEDFASLWKKKKSLNIQEIKTNSTPEKTLNNLVTKPVPSKIYRSSVGTIIYNFKETSPNAEQQSIIKKSEEVKDYDTIKIYRKPNGKYTLLDEAYIQIWDSDDESIIEYFNGILIAKYGENIWLKNAIDLQKYRVDKCFNINSSRYTSSENISSVNNEDLCIFCKKNRASNKIYYYTNVYREVCQSCFDRVDNSIHELARIIGLGLSPDPETIARVRTIGEELYRLDSNTLMHYVCEKSAGLNSRVHGFLGRWWDKVGDWVY